MEASFDQKQRLQQVFFPDGLRFDGEEFGTSVTCLAFKQLSSDQAEKSEMVALRPPSWNQIIGWLREMESLRKSSDRVA